MKPWKVFNSVLNGDKWMRCNPSRGLKWLRFGFVGKLHFQCVHKGEVVRRLWQRRKYAAILRSEEEETHPGLWRPVMSSLQQTELYLVPATQHQLVGRRGAHERSNRIASKARMRNFRPPISTPPSKRCFPAWYACRLYRKKPRTFSNTQYLGRRKSTHESRFKIKWLFRSLACWNILRRECG